MLTAVHPIGGRQAELRNTYCSEESIQTWEPSGPDDRYTMWHMYARYWRPFGELLTDMEREGMQVNR